MASKVDRVWNKFGKYLKEEIIKEYQTKGFQYQGTLKQTIVWDNQSKTLSAPLYFQTLVEGQGRGPGKFAPPDELRPWVRARGLRGRDSKGRFVSLERTTFMVNLSLKEDGNQVYQGKRRGIDVEAATQRALKRIGGDFGSALIADAGF